MENSCDYSFYGYHADEVYGLFEYVNLYYNAPEVSSINRSDLFYCQADFIYSWAYCVEPSYVIYYPVIPVEYSSYYSYETYYVNLPLYSGYYVPNYCLPTSTYYGTDIYPIPFNESSLTYFAVEPNSSIYEEFDCGSYYNENGSYIDTYDTSDDRVGEEITSCDLFYEEYPEMLYDSPVDDGAKSLFSDKKLEDNVDDNGADVSEFTVVDLPDEQPDGVDTNVCDEEVEENILKKVSSMSIAEVQKDIDETYEYGKANLYNEVLKGYTEIKCTLEELEWECHELDDIPEEEEPEDDSDEMDFDENVLKNYKNINLTENLDKNKFHVVEDSSHFVSDSLSEESPLASSEEGLVENYEIMMEDNPLSTDSSVAEEKGKSDPVLEHSLCEEKQYSGSMKNYQEDSSHFASDSLSEESPLASIQEALVDNSEIGVGRKTEEMEVNTLSKDSSAVEENDKKDPVLEHFLCEEKQYLGSVNANQEDYPPVDSVVLEDKHKMISVRDVCSSREEIHSESVSGTEEVCPYMASPVIEENHKMNSIQDLCMSKEKIDSVTFGNTEEPHVNVPSEDRGEEDPVTLEPAASERKQRKKRFSSLRKFFARMCCCVKKPS